MSNQVAELYACLKVFDILTQNELKYFNIKIITDSMYVINCITKWC
jgi:ribonuclease HI